MLCYLRVLSSRVRGLEYVWRRVRAVQARPTRSFRARTEPRLAQTKLASTHDCDHAPTPSSATASGSHSAYVSVEYRRCSHQTFRAVDELPIRVS